MSTSKNTTKAVILSGPTDWPHWIWVIKNRYSAGPNPIWDLINPDLPTEPAIRSQPARPEIQQTGAADFTTSTTAQREHFKYMIDLYKMELADYKAEATLLADAQCHIGETISTKYTIHITKCTSNYHRLQELKKRAAPTDRARKIQLSQKYNSMKSYARTQSVGN